MEPENCPESFVKGYLINGTQDYYYPNGEKYDPRKKRKLNDGGKINVQNKLQDAKGCHG